MKRLVFATFCIAVCAGGGPNLSAQDRPTVSVSGPTVVAFFEPPSSAKLPRDADTNEALADFQLYASHVRKPFKNAGIKFQELYARSFRLRTGEKLITFHPKRMPGYYLVSPGKQPRIEYGVVTDADLLQIANEYFAIGIK